MRSGLNLTIPNDPMLPCILRRLAEAECYAVFVLNALLAKNQNLSGPSYHAHLVDLLQRGLTNEKELHEWIAERITDTALRAKSFDRARKQADLWLQEGRWAASWKGSFPPSDRPPKCPQVLFGAGNLEPDQPWAAFFNSRKPKLVSPQAEWLQILRVMLPFMGAHSVGLASSIGTLTYDLVTAGAEHSGSKLLLVVPMSLEDFGQLKNPPLSDAASFPKVVLTCLSAGVNCPKPTRMVCRDRLLASVSDLHCILELRPGGNLLKIIETQQREQPRVQWICRPASSQDGDEVNPESLQHVFQWATRFSTKDRNLRANSSTKERGLCYPLRLLDTGVIKWQDYLYHYTRSCPGPWPNQSYQCYLESLLNNESLSGHTALETLIRILVEGRITASSKIVRGDQAVVSWTSRPPAELGSIRRWNPALIRWTFEPYGLAVKRGALRKRGARPAIYTTSAGYQRLPHQERFRFQLHEPPHCSWKNEREWRLPKDLDLRGITPDEAFAFVPTASDVKALEEQGRWPLPIAVLG